MSLDIFNDLRSMGNFKSIIKVLEADLPGNAPITNSVVNICSDCGRHFFKGDLQ